MLIFFLSLEILTKTFLQVYEPFHFVIAVNKIAAVVRLLRVTNSKIVIIFEPSTDIKI